MTCDNPSIPGVRNFTKRSLRDFSRMDFFGVVAPFFSTPKKPKKSPDGGRAREKTAGLGIRDPRLY
jgi:hypothetical protein